MVKYLCEKGVIATEEGWKFIEMIGEKRTWGDNIIILYLTLTKTIKKKKLRGIL
ncbi:MAG: hypothetical protein ACOC5L_03240 [Halobacteriota archaeon]